MTSNFVYIGTFYDQALRTFHGNQNLRMLTSSITISTGHLTDGRIRTQNYGFLPHILAFGLINWAILMGLKKKNADSIKNQKPQLQNMASIQNQKPHFLTFSNWDFIQLSLKSKKRKKKKKKL